MSIIEVGHATQKYRLEPSWDGYCVLAIDVTQSSHHDINLRGMK
jgi:hypothetical protein